MSYSVSASLEPGAEIWTIPSLIHQLASIDPPKSISLPYLGCPVHATTDLDPTEGKVVPWNPRIGVSRAAGILEGSAICFVNVANVIGYVHHTKSGDLSQDEFKRIMDHIGASGPQFYPVYVAIAHNHNASPVSQNSLWNLVQWGINSHQIVEINCLFLPQFGLDNRLQLGY